MENVSINSQQKESLYSQKRGTNALNTIKDIKWTNQFSDIGTNTGGIFGSKSSGVFSPDTVVNLKGRSPRVIAPEKRYNLKDTAAINSVLAGLGKTDVALSQAGAVADNGALTLGAGEHFDVKDGKVVVAVTVNNTKVEIAVAAMTAEYTVTKDEQGNVAISDPAAFSVALKEESSKKLDKNIEGILNKLIDALTLQNQY